MVSNTLKLIVFKNESEFINCAVLSVPHVVDNYSENKDELGQNFICIRTLQSLLILINSNFHIIGSREEITLFLVKELSSIC